jgi:hypothetical protein
VGLNCGRRRWLKQRDIPSSAVAAHDQFADGDREGAGSAICSAKIKRDPNPLILAARGGCHDVQPPQQLSNLLSLPGAKSGCLDSGDGVENNSAFSAVNDRERRTAAFGHPGNAGRAVSAGGGGHGATDSLMQLYPVKLQVNATTYLLFVVYFADGD